MKIIFLDIDGALNCNDTFKKIYYKWKETGIRDSYLDDDMFKRLKNVVDETGAKIVLTSTWRNDFDLDLNAIRENGKSLVDKLNEYGLTIYDRFKKDIWSIGEEMTEYLSNNDIESFVIIDDATYDEFGFKDFQVTTRFFEDGFNDNLKEKAIKILKKSR